VESLAQKNKEDALHALEQLGIEERKQI